MTLPRHWIGCQKLDGVLGLKRPTVNVLSAMGLNRHRGLGGARRMCHKAKIRPSKNEPEYTILRHGTGPDPMRHLRPQFMILAGAFALAVLVSLFATTPVFYQKLSLAAHALGPTDLGAGHGMTVFDLGAPSLAAEFDCVARLVAGLPVGQLAVTGLGAGGAGFVTVDPADFREPLRMMFSGSLLMLTVVIFAGLSALRLFLDRRYGAPLRALVDSINAFSDDPSMASPIADEVLRSREFLEAARALETLQRNTLLALRQRERLADIGEAVAKINHDIRNALSSATLVADTILASEDPRVRRMVPHIVRSLEQSVALCQSMMDYLAETPVAEPVRFAMQELVGEISESAGIEMHYAGPEEVRLDRTMMSRILLNLARNAANAGAGRLSIDIWRAGRLGVIDIADDGPGIPREHWNSLFLAFHSKQRGGTGLGLAIARDLAVAQGGALKLTRSTEDGSEFRLQLPMEMFTGDD